VAGELWRERTGALVVWEFFGYFVGFLECLVWFRTYL
jgi:hypothetical protein